MLAPKIWVPASKQALEQTNKHLTENARRKEVLSLYREILRTAKHFHWSTDGDKLGHAGDSSKKSRPWNAVLKEQARKEFEEARNETDPLIIARMLVTGRDCVQQIQNKFNAATKAAWERIEKDTNRRR